MVRIARCWHRSHSSRFSGPGTAPRPRPRCRSRSSRSADRAARQRAGPTDRRAPLPLHAARDRAGYRRGHRLVPAPRQRRALGPRDAVDQLAPQAVHHRRDHVRRRPLQHELRRPPVRRDRLLPDRAGQRAGPGRGLRVDGPRVDVLGVLHRDPREPVAERPHHDAGGGRRHRRGDVPVGALPRAERVGRGALRRRAAVRTSGDAERSPALSSPAQALAEGAAGSGGGLRPRHVQRQHDAERARDPPRGGRRLAA